MKKRVGIIGGMGPLAAVDLMGTIVEMTRAEDDSDHIHIIVDSNPHIPSRADAILRGGTDPLPDIAASAKRLETAGAELLAIACNTAHYYYDGIAAAVNVPVLHMLDETARHCRRAEMGKVALLATDMVLETGLYHRALEQEKVDFVLPDSVLQAEIMRVIFEGVKKNRFDIDVSGLLQGLEAMRKEGVSSFILGCTELPILFGRLALDLPTINPTRVLAAAAIREAGYECGSVI